MLITNSHEDFCFQRGQTNLQQMIILLRKTRKVKNCINIHPHTCHTLPIGRHQGVQGDIDGLEDQIIEEKEEKGMSAAFSATLPHPPAPHSRHLSICN